MRFIFSLIFFQLLFADVCYGVSLRESFTSAYVHNPQILASREGRRVASAQEAAAYLSFLPNADLTASAGYSDVDSSTAFFQADETRKPRSGQLRVRQSLFEGGAKFARTSRAIEHRRAAHASLDDTIQTILLDAITAHLDLIRDQSLLNLAKNNEKVLKRQLEATEQRYAVGEVTQTDVSQAQARHAAAVAEHITAQATLAGTRARFRQITYLDKATPNEINPPIIGIIPLSLDEAQTIAKNHPAVRKSYHDFQAAREDVSESFSSILPSVTVEGAMSRDFDAFNRNSRSDSLSVTARLTVPLFYPSDYARIDAARSVRKQKDYLYRASLETIKRNVTTTWHGWNAAKARMNSFEAQVKAAKLALEGVIDEAQFGQRDTLDVLNAEQEFFRAQTDLVRARRDHAVFHYRFLAAIGKLNQETLLIAHEDME